MSVFIRWRALRILGATEEYFPPVRKIVSEPIAINVFGETGESSLILQECLLHATCTGARGDLRFQSWRFSLQSFWFTVASDSSPWDGVRLFIRRFIERTAANVVFGSTSDEPPIGEFPYCSSMIHHSVDASGNSIPLHTADNVREFLGLLPGERPEISVEEASRLEALYFTPIDRLRENRLADLRGWLCYLDSRLARTYTPERLRDAGVYSVEPGPLDGLWVCPFSPPYPQSAEDFAWQNRALMESRESRILEALGIDYSWAREYWELRRALARRVKQ